MPFVSIRAIVSRYKALTEFCMRIHKVNPFILLFVATLTSLSAYACIGDETAERSHSIHIVPQLPPAATFSRWAPLLEKIGQKAGLCFDLVIPDSISAFETVLWSGKTDFAFSNPYHEVVAKKRKGYVPLLIDSRSRLSGLVVVRSDSGIQNVKQLNGKEMAFPSPNAFAASLLIRAELAKQGINIFPKYLKTHANVYRSVAVGDVVAGGGVNNTLMREEEGLRKSLRVIYETDTYAPHPMVVHPRVPRKVRSRFTAAVLDLAKDSTGQALLDAVQMPAPVTADYRRDFFPLEKLPLERLAVLYAD